MFKDVAGVRGAEVVPLVVGTLAGSAGFVAVVGVGGVAGGSGVFTVAGGNAGTGGGVAFVTVVVVPAVADSDLPTFFCQPGGSLSFLRKPGGRFSLSGGSAWADVDDKPITARVEVARSNRIRVCFVFIGRHGSKPDAVSGEP